MATPRVPGEVVRLKGRRGWWTITQVFTDEGSTNCVFAVREGDSKIDLVFSSAVEELEVRTPAVGGQVGVGETGVGSALSPLIVSDLRSAQSDEQLGEVLLAGRLAGWSLKELAAPLGVTPERVRQRAAAADKERAQQRSQSYPRPLRHSRERLPRRGGLLKERRINGFNFSDPVLRVPVTTLVELSRLAKSATSVRGLTPLDAPERGDVEIYKKLVVDTLETFDVPVRSLERALGYRTGMIRDWLARHGHGKRAPSQPAYKGVQTDRANARR